LIVCVDSSFLLSSYVGDSHSSEADQRLASGPELWITPLNRAEFGNALYQLVFRGMINADAANKVWSNFDRDCSHGPLVSTSLPESIWESSIDLARRYGARFGVRMLDSLHVACALELGAERFWTFDERQAKLAEAVGLNTGA
jgi:predicted nucleic acid-binding protein